MRVIPATLVRLAISIALLLFTSLLAQCQGAGAQLNSVARPATSQTAPALPHTPAAAVELLPAGR